MLYVNLSLYTSYRSDIHKKTYQRKQKYTAISGVSVCRYIKCLGNKDERNLLIYHLSLNASKYIFVICLFIRKCKDFDFRAFFQETMLTFWQVRGQVFNIACERITFFDFNVSLFSFILVTGAYMYRHFTKSSIQ